MAFRPFLTCTGNCREAFTRYQEVFGGELALLTMADAPTDTRFPPPETNPDAIVHAALTAGGDLLMGADDPSGGFDGNGSGMCVSYSVTDPEQAKQVFDALCEGGQVRGPFGQTLLSPAFGMCTDGFGTRWMVMAETPTGP